MQKKDGFSFIELVVVVAILIILLSIATPMLMKYLKEYKVEEEISNIYSSLSSQRFKSMNSGIPHGIVFNSPTQYTVFTFNDKNYNLEFDGVQEEKNAKTIYLKYPLRGLNAGTVILFDINGIVKTSNWASGTFTMYINYPAKYNCLSVSPGRIKTGVWDGTACKVK